MSTNSTGRALRLFLLRSRLVRKLRELIFRGSSVSLLPLKSRERKDELSATNSMGKCLKALIDTSSSVSLGNEVTVSGNAEIEHREACKSSKFTSPMMERGSWLRLGLQDMSSERKACSCPRHPGNSSSRLWDTSSRCSTLSDPNSAGKTVRRLRCKESCNSWSSSPSSCGSEASELADRSSAVSENTELLNILMLFLLPTSSFPDSLPAIAPSGRICKRFPRTLSSFSAVMPSNSSAAATLPILLAFMHRMSLYSKLQCSRATSC
mmetsp:Transcript_2302/g.3150  ORF Transcript_2302/g.3150 Transcript_2302/m.3150 type:complete len:266 (+) Transcript_2302:1005-1802(+)